MRKCTKKPRETEAQNQPVFPIKEFVRAQLLSFVVSLGLDQLYKIREDERTALCEVGVQRGIGCGSGKERAAEIRLSLLGHFAGVEALPVLTTGIAGALFENREAESNVGMTARSLIRMSFSSL